MTLTRYLKEYNRVNLLLEPDNTDRTPLLYAVKREAEKQIRIVDEIIDRQAKKE